MEGLGALTLSAGYTTSQDEEPLDTVIHCALEVAIGQQNCANYPTSQEATIHQATSVRVILLGLKPEGQSLEHTSDPQVQKLS